MKKRSIVIGSGYYNPIHLGHIQFFKEAKELVENKGKLVIIVNNDKQAIEKRGYKLLDLESRMEIVGSIRYVDEVHGAVDDDKSVCKTLEKIFDLYGAEHCIFANGGDRFNDEIPEARLCKEYGAEIVEDIGGGKFDSSTNIINRIYEGEKKKREASS